MEYHAKAQIREACGEQPIPQFGVRTRAHPFAALRLCVTSVHPISGFRIIRVRHLMMMLSDWSLVRNFYQCLAACRNPLSRVIPKGITRGRDFWCGMNLPNRSHPERSGRKGGRSAVEGSRGMEEGRPS